MISIAAAIFDMNRTAVRSDHCLDNERPALTVTLSDDSSMGVSGATLGEYAPVNGVSPLDATACGTDCRVVAASSNMVAAVANALSSSAGLTAC